jgi:hypothetical protein
MSINLASHYILFSKGQYVIVTKALIISFIILTASDVVMRENADASLSSSSSYLQRLNSDYKLQTLQQKVSQNASQFESILPPADFAFSYSFGVIGETNNTLSSEHDVYIQENKGAQPISKTLTLSAAQMQSIWTTIMEMRFFQITNNFTENCDKSGNCILVTPEHYSILKITANNNTHTVAVRDAYAFPHDDEYHRFKSLVNEIDRMVLTILPKEDNNAIPSNDREPERGLL